jgi:endonuclease/exonuclease/phosphatase (EEP) superfamily protein YafD
MLKNFLNAVVFLASIALCMLIAVVGLQFLARDYWWADMATHFGVHLTIAFSLLFLFFVCFRRWNRSLLSLALAIWYGVMAAPLFVPALLPTNISVDDPQATRILQFNLRYTDLDAKARMQWVADHADKMDLIVLLEVEDQHDSLIYTLRQKFPSYFIKQMRGYRGVAIFSRLKHNKYRLKDTVEKTTYYVVMTADNKRTSKPMAIFVVHPPPPVEPELAFVHKKYFEEVLEDVKSSPIEPKIIVGDFNMTRWSPNFNDFTTQANMKDSFEGFGYKTTWPSWMPKMGRITIDNLLVSRAADKDNALLVLDKEIGDSNGSDHFPVITTLY